MKYFINLKKLINLRNGKKCKYYPNTDGGINTKEDSYMNSLNDSIDAQKL